MKRDPIVEGFLMAAAQVAIGCAIALYFILR